MGVFNMALIENEIKNKVYVCKYKNRGDIPIWLGILIPLIAFVPDDYRKIEYCKKLNK